MSLPSYPHWQSQICNFRYVVDNAGKESEAEDPMIHISHEVWIDWRNFGDFDFERTH